MDNSFILQSMIDEEELSRRVKALDIRRGKNLTRLRNRSGFSQARLSEKTGIAQTNISAHENGKGFEKETMLRYCFALNAEEWEFDLDKDTPIVKDELEQQDLFRRREARALNVAEDTASYETYKIAEAKKKKSSGNEGKAGGVPRRSHKRAG